jgi:NAD(P)H-flavin reductase
VQEHAAKIVEERAARLGLPPIQPEVDPAIPKADLKFDIYCYICGLNFMVSAARDKLAGYGWHRKQIVFERYD